MQSARASPIELEVSRIRELSKDGRHSEALVAAELLAVAAPQNRDLLYLIAANQRCLNRIHEALETLRRMEQLHPRFSLLYQERGYCYTTLRDAPRAIEAFLRGVDINPALAKSWRMLEHLFRMTGDARNAAAAAERISSLKNLPPEVVRAGSLFSDGDLSAAENILRAYLRTSSDDVEALRLLARIQHQRDVLDEAESLLEAALEVKPNYVAARLDYVRVLIDWQKYMRAREETSPRALPLPLCVIHGEHDTVVAGKNAAEVLRQFLVFNGRVLPGSAALPDADASLTTPLPNGRTMTVDDYRMDGRVVARRVRVSGLGHAWSGGDGALAYNDPHPPDATALFGEFCTAQFGRRDIAG